MLCLSSFLFDGAPSLIEVDGRVEYLSLHAGEVFYRAAWEHHGYSPASFVAHPRRGALLEMEFSHPCDICRRRLIQQELDYSSQRGRVLVSPTPWAQDVGLLGAPLSPAPRQPAPLDPGRRESACGLGRGSGRVSGASV